MKKSWSIGSESQELEPQSQHSNYSDNPETPVRRFILDLEAKRKVTKLEKLKLFCGELGVAFPSNINFPITKNVKFIQNKMCLFYLIVNILRNLVMSQNFCTTSFDFLA